MALVNLKIDQSDFRDLAITLINDMTTGEDAPISDAIDRYKEYLDGSVDMTEDQKAGSMAGFLRETYADIAKQSFGTAFELMKENAKLQIQMEETNANVDLTNKKAETETYSTEIARLKSLGAVTENTILGKKEDEMELKNEEMRAKLQKQYGVVPTGGLLTNTVDKGAIDKQIEGYDKVNYKDILKTSDEKASLMQNAKIPESLTEKKTRAELIYKISGVKTSFIDGGLTYTVVNDNWDAEPLVWTDNA